MTSVLALSSVALSWLGQPAIAKPDSPAVETPAQNASNREPSASPSDELERGRRAYDRGDYEQAIRLLAPLLYPEPRLGSESDQVAARRMVGTAYLFENRTQDAQKEFRKLLQLRPTFQFDPLLESPQVVEFFDRVRKEQSAELLALETRRREAEAARQRELAARMAAPKIIEKRIIKSLYGLNFVPFGVGQFQNGQPQKGWKFLSTEATLAALSVGTFIVNFAYFGTSPARCVGADAMTGMTVASADGMDVIRRCFTAREEQTSNALKWTSVGAGAAFYAVAVWGIVDALMHHRPEREADDSGSSNSEQQRSTSPTRPRLSLSPTLLPPADGQSALTVGLGLGLKY